MIHKPISLFFFFLFYMSGLSDNNADGTLEEEKGKKKETNRKGAES